MAKKIALFPEKEIEKNWTAKVKKKLVGKTIVDARYMTDKEVEESGWYKKGIVLVLNDGNIIYPMADDEGNDSGAMGTSFKELITIPVIRQ